MEFTSTELFVFALCLLCAGAPTARSDVDEAAVVVVAESTQTSPVDEDLPPTTASHHGTGRRRGLLTSSKFENYNVNNTAASTGFYNETAYSTDSAVTGSYNATAYSTDSAVTGSYNATVHSTDSAVTASRKETVAQNGEAWTTSSKETVELGPQQSAEVYLHPRPGKALILITIIYLKLSMWFCC